MTLKPINAARVMCEAINLEVINAERRFIIYRGKGGPLLRSFEIYGASINAHDFNSWWQFMEFPSDGMRS